MWIHRQTISNFTFESEYEIGKAVLDWIITYNKKRVIKLGQSIYVKIYLIFYTTVKGAKLNYVNHLPNS